jgi:hypothetical protein
MLTRSVFGESDGVLLGLADHIVGVHGQLLRPFLHPEDLSHEPVGIAGLGEGGVDHHHGYAQQFLDAFGIGDGRLVDVAHADDDIGGQLDDLFHVAGGVLAEPTAETDHRPVFRWDVGLLLLGGRDVPPDQEFGGQGVDQVGGRRSGEPNTLSICAGNGSSRPAWSVMVTMLWAVPGPSGRKRPGPSRRRRRTSRRQHKGRRQSADEGAVTRTAPEVPLASARLLD